MGGNKCYFENKYEYLCQFIIYIKSLEFKF